MYIYTVLFLINAHQQKKPHDHGTVHNHKNKCTTLTGAHPHHPS